MSGFHMPIVAGSPEDYERAATEPTRDDRTAHPGRDWARTLATCGGLLAALFAALPALPAGDAEGRTSFVQLAQAPVIPADPMLADATPADATPVGAVTKDDAAGHEDGVRHGVGEAHRRRI